MTRERASIFAGTEALDVSAFAPKAVQELNGASAELVRGIAEASRFPSREAKTNSPAEASKSPARRPPRIHRTGRTMQFNARTTPQTVTALYAIADQQGWLVGETLEHALAALQRELAGVRARDAHRAAIGYLSEEESRRSTTGSEA
jgi:hypothetical protein